MSSLTKREEKTLVALLSRLSLPASLTVFYAWCRVFGTTCAEVAVLREGTRGTEVFLTYRKDRFFKGWHLPGRVHLPAEQIEDTLGRVLREEVHLSGKLSARFFGVYERMRGTRPGQSRRGHEFALVYVVRAKGTIVENAHEKFFPLSALPRDVMKHQKPIFDDLRARYAKKRSRRKTS